MLNSTELEMSTLIGPLPEQILLSAYFTRRFSCSGMRTLVRSPESPPVSARGRHLKRVPRRQQRRPWILQLLHPTPHCDMELRWSLQRLSLHIVANLFMRNGLLPPVFVQSPQRMSRGEALTVKTSREPPIGLKKSSCFQITKGPRHSPSLLWSEEGMPLPLRGRFGVIIYCIDHHKTLLKLRAVLSSAQRVAEHEAFEWRGKYTWALTGKIGKKLVLPVSIMAKAISFPVHPLKYSTVVHSKSC